MLCFVFAALVVLLDQLFKRWIVLTLAVGEETVLIKGVLNLYHVNNKGAAFSILPEQRWLLAGIALVAALVLIAILLRYNEGFLGTIGLASVLGGAVGNLIDRVFHGFVVDMFRTTFMEFAIFNIADIFITLGGITFCIFFIVTSFKSGKTAEADSGQEEPAQTIEQYDSYEYREPREEIDFDKLFYEDTDPDMAAGNDPSRFGFGSGGAPQQDYDYGQQDLYSPSMFPDSPYDSGDPGYAPNGAAYNEPASEGVDGSSTLDALGLLESEISSVVEDYDLDELLREYGFEDDNS